MTSQTRAAINGNSYGVYIAILSILIVIEYMFFPETKGLTVEEIGLIFETGRKGDRLLAANQLRSRLGHHVEDEPLEHPNANNAQATKTDVRHVA